MKTNLSFVILLAWSLSAPAVTIDTVPVGNVGNANDPATRNLYGGVSYGYGIGKYEVTVSQYTAFLNAVAATDTYSLYNTHMASDLNSAGIAQSCTPNCTYSVIGSANHPVTYVSWGDAARFSNWLDNGQPTGAQNASTTEDGAYTLDGAITSAALSTVTRNTRAAWFIPTENEWYKAAYYQPAAQGGDTDGYWKYPVKANSVPYSDQPPGATPDNTRVINFYQGDFVANGYDDGYAVTGSTSHSSSQNYLTDVGAYISSPSYYGTFHQGGNVSEWNETKVFSERGVRGGEWEDTTSLTPPVAHLSASHRENWAPTNENNKTGFRMATLAVPEPASLFLLLTELMLANFSCIHRGRRNG